MVGDKQCIAILYPSAGKILVSLGNASQLHGYTASASLPLNSTPCKHQRPSCSICCQGSFCRVVLARSTFEGRTGRTSVCRTLKSSEH